MALLLLLLSVVVPCSFPDSGVGQTIVSNLATELGILRLIAFSDW